MSPKEATLRIAQERDCTFVDADDDATVDNGRYAANNGLGSLVVRRSAGRYVRGALGESAELLVKGEERELLTAFFWIVQRTARKKRGNNFYFGNIPCV
jgi:hypothetical protein